MSKNKFLSFISLFVFLLSLNFSVFAQENNDEIIKVDVALVNIPVIISDKNGRYISGLSMDNFTLFEDGKQQKIEYLTNAAAPLNIVILLDTSKSTYEIVDKLKNAAREFIKQLQPADKCMIISISNKVQVESEFTSNQKVLDRAIKNTMMGEKYGTLLNDAIFATVDKELAKIRGRKAVVLLTDGKDAGSSKSKNDLIYRLEESDAPIYSIIYETSNFLTSKTQPTNQKSKIYPTPLSKTNPQQIPKLDRKTTELQQKKKQEVADFMQKISEVTAGRIYLKEIENLSEAFENIANELRKQYLIGYYPEDPNYATNQHQIKVRVNKSDVVVRTKNYYRLR